ncbi:hypothetical protein FA15DRAFT_703303 [Coprinopsis marcescibilis]|uniref:Uncharacterized protein n=1 Tax=Coprinopsis marcescibilis TaxID=230819 RepID=A0A5C3KZX1_COPMA|nr:hypothetical protein FA15DRAFT_703303 [Coprinopsis marcescibilis]
MSIALNAAAYYSEDSTTGSIDLFLLTKYQMSVKVVDPPFDLIRCLQSDANYELLAAVWGVVLGNEILMMLLTLVAGYRKHKDSRGPLLDVFYRNGAAYFVALATISASNIAVSFIYREHLYLTSTIQHTLHAIFATRMIIHIRQTARSSDGVGELSQPLEPLRWRAASQSVGECGISDRSGFTA